MSTVVGHEQGHYANFCSRRLNKQMSRRANFGYQTSPCLPPSLPPVYFGLTHICFNASAPSLVLVKLAQLCTVSLNMPWLIGYHQAWSGRLRQKKKNCWNNFGTCLGCHQLVLMLVVCSYLTCVLLSSTFYCFFFFSKGQRKNLMWLYSIICQLFTSFSRQWKNSLLCIYYKINIQFHHVHSVDYATIFHLCTGWY